MTKYPLFRLLSVPVALLLVAAVGACSSERKSIIGHSYENIVARDNGFFLAREKLRATEATLYKARVNDYNRVLPLFPTLDDATVARVTADLDDVIKKASLPIQHRPGSDWTDDSYLLIGQARYYKKEYEDAGKTFKYVNTTSKDANARHEALIWLMRTFLATKELENAAAVSDLLDKEQGSGRNARELFLTRAEYFLQTGDQLKAIENLTRALPYIKPKNELSRTRYILAQLYQATNQDKEAYAQLNKILKRNPPYELDFFAKLMLGQVSDLNTTDKARLDKYFAKLLKDTKNKEYRDKIYYEMARLDYRQQRYDNALALLRQSARATTSNKAQKSYTYLLAGRIYYENLQKYPLAAAYYDSTVQNMPREAPEYAATVERSAILKDFARQTTIISTQDSLQALARLDSATLRTRLTDFATAELVTRKKNEERQAALVARQAQRQQTASTNAVSAFGNVNTDPLAAANSTTGALWYFDNPTALTTARGEFIRKWGDRKLQDNWRTTSQASASAVTSQGGNVPVSIAGADGVRVNPTTGAPAAAADPAAQVRGLVAGYRQNLPLTEAQLKASQKQVEEALFALGGIYNQQLREPVQAADTYEKLVTRFPGGVHTPETYYSLYLLYKEKNDPRGEAYAQKLRTEYPNSSYARLVADPEYLRRTSVANAQVGVLLDSAFTFYKKQEFTKSSAVLARARKQYPVTDLNDRVAFLTTLITIRTKPPVVAKAAVDKFQKDYPESPLLSQAQALLGSYKRYEEGQIAGALASTDKPVISVFRPGEVDNRMRIFYGENETPAKPVPAPPASVPVPAPKPSATDAAPATMPAATPPAAPASKPKLTRRQARKASTPPTDSAGTAAPNTPVVPLAAPTPASAPAAPVKPATPYTTNLAAGHAVVLAFPKGAAPLKDLPALLSTYNNRFFKASNLQVQQSALGDSLDLVVVQSLPGAKVAQSYALKLRGPQAPLSKLRGVGYQTLIIGIDNMPLLLQSKDLAEYQRFYQKTYSK
ncbi:hypothetical protein SAMN02745146_0577 [Hymenobacter daecheongensis DSM 21074]|uniref:Uncharacterized protein n=1 Tax=Hymenobacter daecheongensis DSM 21074 TaxID=1121955 RepID=A0A1M6ABC9_9BACT|nr:tetratricopeptide repeat protein [Hymenobacter daecheongensis]SHI33792.1 hypothetical protein SAMN02745146_0577 [Hymenobacter daecheongensis DSM 21074]